MPFSTITPLRTRESFFRDPYFSDCWDAMGLFEGNSSSLGSSSRFSDDDFELRLRPLYRRRQHVFPTSTLRSEFEDSKNFGVSSSSLSGLGIQTDETAFKVSIDVQQFRPEELVVKTVDNNTLLIEGKHEEKEDSHGFISRNFSRKVTLPADIKVEEIQSTFTQDGLLTITAPRHKALSTNATATANSVSETSSATLQSSCSGKSGTEEQKTTSTSSNSSTSGLSQRIEEERKRAEAEFEKSTSDILGRRDERKHFGDRIFQAFPEFDPLPFWKRGRDSLLQDDLKVDRKSASSLLDDLKINKQSSSSVLDDFASLKSTKTAGFSESGKDAELQSDSENFRVMLDVQQFKPEELTIKTFDSFIEIEGKHEAKSDSYGFMTRQFKRKYILPLDVRSEDVQCHLSSEGILLITAPRIVKRLHDVSSSSEKTKSHLLQDQSHQQGREIVHKVGTAQEENSRTQLGSAAAAASVSLTSGSKLDREHVIPIENQQSRVSAESHQKSTIKTEKQEQGERVNANATSANGDAAGSSLRTRVRAKTPEFPMSPDREVIPIEEHSGYGSFIRRVDENDFRPRSNVSGTEAKAVSSPAPPAPAPVLAKGERLIQISIGA